MLSKAAYMAFRPLIKRFLHYICYLSARVRVRVAGALYLISITLVTYQLSVADICYICSIFTEGDGVNEVYISSGPVETSLDGVPKNYPLFNLTTFFDQRVRGKLNST
jgi:hypothetical protein